MLEVRHHVEYRIKLFTYSPHLEPFPLLIDCVNTSSTSVIVTEKHIGASQGSGTLLFKETLKQLENLFNRRLVF